MKILIIQQKMIGDVLTSTVLFPILKASYPNASLHYVVNSHTIPVVEHHPDIDYFQIITPEIEKSSVLFFSFLKKIRKENYDVVIDVYSTFSSNLITLFTGASKKISKYKWYTSFVYTHTFKEHKTPISNAGLAIENRVKLLNPLCDQESLKYVPPKIYLKKYEIEAAKKVLSEFKINLSAPLFMISVLGSDETKTYPLQYMAKLIDFIVEATKGEILLNYIPNQKEYIKELIDSCKRDTVSHIHLHIFGKSIREFIALTYHCNGLIGNEGGAINMAKAIEKPTFAIFSPWILKEAWSIFEDGKKNDSIHLKEVKPELFTNNDPKLIKKQYHTLYKEFTPNLIKPKLKAFLKAIL